MEQNTMETTDKYAEDSFFHIRWILRYAGLWAPDTKNKTVQTLYKLYAIFIFLFVNIFFTATELATLIDTYGNEDDLIKNLSFALTHFMGTVKAIFFYFKGNELIELMNILESKELRYEPCVERNFFPGAISRKTKAAITKYTLICFAMPHLTLFASYIPPTLAAILVMYDGNSTRQLPERLPYYSWVPFKFDTGSAYLMALGYQAGPMFSYGYSISGMDALCYGLSLCIAGNLAIIQGAFLTIRERSLKRIKGPEWDDEGLNNSACLNAAMNSEMRSICRNLQTVLKACADLDNLQKYVILAQVSTIQIILCSCLYLVSSVPVNSKQFYAEIVYLVAMGIQPFFLCLFGNEVTLQAENITDNLWRCDWLAADREFKTSMVITMARLRKPVSLTAGNFAPLTLTTFVAIMKASYSFFAFLKNTTDE